MRRGVPSGFLSVFGGKKMKLLNQAEAAAIDQELFNEYGFSVDQLMELAGLSCAHAVASTYLLPASRDGGVGAKDKILVACGPGNNGGDGMVCARHLKVIAPAFRPQILYPKPGSGPLFENLVRQCRKMNLTFLESVPSVEELNSEYVCVVDAVFGFSFRPPVRPLFEPVIRNMARTDAPVISIDVPSGWHVEDGAVPAAAADGSSSGPPDAASALKPDALVSLTAPKLCAAHFAGRHHFLGGRFVPEDLAAKYKLDLPPYPGISTFVKLS